MTLFFLFFRRWGFLVLSLLLPLGGWALTPDPIPTQPVSVTSPPISVTPTRPISVSTAGDTDGDGVANEADLCPGTSPGTVVNTYGCPLSAAVCSYTTSTVSLNSAGGSGNGTIRYVLADSVGTILQVSSIPTFSGLSGSHTYMALALSYDGSATGLTAGQSLSAVSGSCYDWSDAVVLRVCANTDGDGDGVPDDRDLCSGTPAGVPVNAYGCPKIKTTCDYTATSFTLASTGGAGGGTVRYVLADSVGTILQVSSIPAFSGLSGSHTYMALALSYDGSATGLTAGQSLNAVSGSCYDWSDAVVLKVCATTDSDGDGVTDPNDWCPNTPAGTLVNAYGCPKTSVTCDYTTSSITLASSGSSGSGTVRYVLADSVGIILQINPTASFSGLSGSHTYLAAAVRYDGLATGLAIGQSLSTFSASCYDWSDALVIKVCVPVSSTCDYTIGATINLVSAGGSATAGTLTRYLLVNASGRIVGLNTSPKFNTTGLLPGTYAAYALIYTDDQSLVNLETGRSLTTIQANCMALSSPLTLTLCQNCVAKCVPIIITKNRR